VDGCTTSRSRRPATSSLIPVSARKASQRLQLTSAHDSSISLVYPSAPGQPPAAHISVRLPSLPYLSLTFISENSLIAAGHDCQPVLYTGDESGWALSHSLDDPATAGSRALTPSATGGRPTGGVGRLNNEAFNRFKQADSRGQTGPPVPGAKPSAASGGAAVGPDGLLLTVHQNSITWVDAYEWGANGEVSKVSTAGRDGKLVIWPVTAKGAAGLAGKMGNLHV